MSNVFKLRPTHFSKEGKKGLGGLRPPAPLVTGMRWRNGQETTVSTSYLALFPMCSVNTGEISSDVGSNHSPPNSVENFTPACHDTSSTADETFARSPSLHSPSPNTNSSPLPPHEDVQPSVCLRGQETPLIGLVTGPRNFEGGECGGFVARGCLHQLLIDWFFDCSPHRIALHGLRILFRTCVLVSDSVELPTRQLLCLLSCVADVST